MLVSGTRGLRSRSMKCMLLAWVLLIQMSSIQIRVCWPLQLGKLKTANSFAHVVGPLCTSELREGGRARACMRAVARGLRGRRVGGGRWVGRVSGCGGGRCDARRCRLVGGRATSQHIGYCSHVTGAQKLEVYATPLEVCNNYHRRAARALRGRGAQRCGAASERTSAYRCRRRKAGFAHVRGRRRARACMQAVARGLRGRRVGGGRWVGRVSGCGGANGGSAGRRSRWVGAPGDVSAYRILFSCDGGAKIGSLRYPARSV